MAERSRIHLPSLGAITPHLGSPTIDEARRALGGPALGERTGERVEIDRGRGRLVEGLVVLGSPLEQDVWIGDGVFARVRAPERARPLARPTPKLDAAAADLARFATLRVGDRAAARRGAGDVTGRVLELCRYGALLDVEGKVVAVGFRGLRPAEG